MVTKLNIREPRDEGKQNVGVSIYHSDKLEFEKVAHQHGMPVSAVLRSLINDFIDGNITIEK